MSSKCQRYWKQNDETKLYFRIYTSYASRFTVAYLNITFIITCGNCRFSKTDKAVYSIPKIKLQMGQCLVPQTKQILALKTNKTHSCASSKRAMALPDSTSEARTERSTDPDKITGPNHSRKKTIRTWLSKVRNRKYQSMFPSELVPELPA